MITAFIFFTRGDITIQSFVIVLLMMSLIGIIIGWQDYQFYEKQLPRTISIGFEFSFPTWTNFSLLILTFSGIDLHPKAIVKSKETKIDDNSRIMIFETIKNNN